MNILGVRPRRARARRQALQVDADAHEARGLSGTAERPHLLGALRVDVRAFGQVASRNDEGRTLGHGGSFRGQSDNAVGCFG